MGIKIQFNVCNGSHRNSTKESGWMTPKELGYSDSEWLALTEEAKQAVCKDWANNHLDIYYEEKED